MTFKVFAMRMIPLAAFVSASVGADGQVIRPGTHAAQPGPSSHFTGDVTVEPVSKPSLPGQAGSGLVSFARGARSNWHRHPAGQILFVTEGCGWTQSEGGPVERICKGDTVYAAPGVKHWHGATRSSGMRHLAVTETLAGANVTWLEPVSDDQFHGPEA